MEYLILAINPGSTSTKIALFKNKKQVFKETIEHHQNETEKYTSIIDEIPMRKAVVLKALEKIGVDPKSLSAVVGRGGLFPPVETGGYIVNRKMLKMIIDEEIPSHASNLGAVLADDIAKLAGAPAYIYDAVSANEFPPVAKITGMKEVERKSYYHVLNSRAVAIRYAKSLGKKYDELNLLIAHLGGAITVGAHKGGKIIDSLSDDNGPFAPQRAGNVPLIEVIEMCYSGRYSKEEMIKKVRGLGGLRSLLGTSDGREITRMVESGNEYAALIMEAQAYQIAKGIALLSPALKGQCDAIIITGGLAWNELLIQNVKGYISFLAPIVILPGEYEMEALALGCLRILRGEEAAKEM